MAETKSEPSKKVVQNHVNGEWVAPTSDEGQPIRNPATGEQLGHVSFSSAADIDDAVESGQEAFETWRKTPIEERIQPLFQYKQLLEDNLDEMAELIVQDHGKTLAEARGEIRRGIENVETACAAPSTHQAGSLPNAAPQIDETAVRRPLGVFAAITPFNFPAMLPLWFLPHAIATGNSIIVKPSERNPLVVERLFELLEETDLPDGVAQLINGAADTVNGLLEHDGIEGVSFVGSTPVARHVYETAAEHGKRVQAQGGAKNHIIVTESANLEFAAEKTISSACACAGERCLANDIALVEESVYDEFRDLIVEKAETLSVGYGLDEGVDVGALTTPDHEQRVRDYIESGIEEGATLLVDGRDVSVEGYEDGNFLGPTVFADVNKDMKIAQEEVFGPMLGLEPIANIDSAIERLNVSDFGNAASLFTDSGADARAFRHDAEVGNIAVNAGTAAPMAFFSFGGRGESFFGDLHAQGDNVVRFYTDQFAYIERWPDA